MVFWVFGYGSLVWNPGFEFDEKIKGFIKNYKRVFDLACIDHRGTPDHPARTCTLEEAEGSICWGVAYCVSGDPEKERAAMEYLERRECEYDKKTLVDFYKLYDCRIICFCSFTSTPDKISNKYYLGPAPLEDMARQIATASGPCGNNRDYLFLLEKALFDIGEHSCTCLSSNSYALPLFLAGSNLLMLGNCWTGHEDDHIIELANEVRKVLGTVGKIDKKLVGPSHIPLKDNVPSLILRPLQGAIATDSS
ncbi:hypothetical protein ACJRO7_014823 [Eucalyptus globulus]|uniref:glutathione-specific gamma-glutamylcyclotransferase n=1 Tax=Eucalyptus globulus TaxID=34317 RepID=A0ABD3L1G7_EUCGL